MSHDYRLMHKKHLKKKIRIHYDKNSHKPEIEDIILNLLKGIYRKPTVNIILKVS